MYANAKEFQVNEYTDGFQQNQKMTYLKNGNFVITWESELQDNSGLGIYAKLFDSTGKAITNEFKVNTYTMDDQKDAKIVTLENGNFVVTWNSDFQDEDQNGVYAKVFDKDGNPVSEEFQINSVSQGNQTISDISTQQNSDFTILWQDDDKSVYSKTFDSTGTALSSDIKIDENIALFYSPKVETLNNGLSVVSWGEEVSSIDGVGIGKIYAEVLDSAGNIITEKFEIITQTTYSRFPSKLEISPLQGDKFVVTWEGIDDKSDIFAKIIDSKGNEISPSFKINEYTNLSQSEQEITVLKDGNFVVTWTSSMQDGSRYGVYAKVYTPEGTEVSKEFLVNTFTSHDQRVEEIVALENGNFVVAWNSAKQDGNLGGAYAKVFDPSGNAISDEFRINYYTTSFQGNPEIIALEDGNFAISWVSANQDGSGYGVYAKVYDPVNNPPVEVNNPPQIDNIYSQLVEEGSSINIPFSVSDKDGHNITTTVTASNGFAEIVNNEIVFTPSEENNKPSLITITAVDEKGAVATKTFDVHTSPTNTPSELGLNYTNDILMSDLSFSANSPKTIQLDKNKFLLSWETWNQDSSGSGIYAKIIDENGLTLTEEFQINTFFEGQQFNADITSLSNGNIVFTWVSIAQDGSKNGIFTKVFDKDGNQISDEIGVNTYIDDHQYNPSILDLENGNFIISWQSKGQDGSGFGIYSKTFDSNGNPITQDVQVNTETLNDQKNAQLVNLKNSNYIISWNSDSNEYFKLFNSEGNALSEDIIINNAKNTKIEVLETGGFVVVYEENNILQAKIFDENAVQVSNSIQIAESNEYLQKNAEITTLSNGDFVVSWISNETNTQYPNERNFEISAKLFDKNGIAKSNAIEVNEYSRGEQQNITLTTLKNDDFVISWQSEGSDGSGTGIAARVFDANANALTKEFQVNNASDSYQTAPSIISTDNTGFILSWESSDNNGNTGIYTKVYNYEDGSVNDNQAPIINIENPLKTDDLQINTHIKSNQQNQDITTLDNGNIVVTWQSKNQDGSNFGIFAKILDENGNALSNEIQINEHTRNAQINPEISSLDNGNFVVTWQSNGQDGSNFGIFAKIFDENGNSVSNEFKINEYTKNAQSNPDITTLGGGEFVITWQSKGQDGSNNEIFARVFNEDGSAKSSELHINEYTKNAQSNPEISALENGNFVVTWESKGQDGSSTGIFARIYDEEGNDTNSEFQINDYSKNIQSNADVSSLDNGNFVVTWQSKGQDGSNFGIFAKFFDIDGNPIGNEFQINECNKNAQTNPVISSLENGNFVITWESKAQDGSSTGIFAKVFDQDNNAISSEFQINEYSKNSQINPEISPLDNGNFMVTWQSKGQDGSGFGIFAKVFDQNGNEITNIQENETLTIPFNAEDPDNDQVNTTVEAINGKAEIIDGQISFTPELDYQGEASVILTAIDDKGASSSKTININVVNSQVPLNDEETVDIESLLSNIEETSYKITNSPNINLDDILDMNEMDTGPIEEETIINSELSYDSTSEKETTINTYEENASTGESIMAILDNRDNIEEI